MRAQALERLEQLAIGARGLLVLEAVVAELLDRVGEVVRVGVAPLLELVHARRLEAVALAQALLLAVEQLLEAPGELLARAADLVAQLLEQLREAHHAHVEAGELEAVLAHPLERGARVEALHHQVRERVERALGVETELVLAAVPAAVDARLHDRA